MPYFEKIFITNEWRASTAKPQRKGNFLGSVGIMITPGGIGLYPAIVKETLLLYGVLNTTGLALGWIAWTAQTIMILIVGGISLLLLSFSKAENEKP